MDKSRKQDIRSRWREILSSTTSKAKMQMNGEPTWICPFCGHGTNGDGMTFIPAGRGDSDGNTLKCFGCGWSGDSISYLEELNGLDFRGAVAEAERILCLPPSDDSRKESAPSPRPPEKAKAAAEEKPVDYTEYIKECQKHIGEAEARAYLTSRGLSVETAREYGIGYDKAAKGGPSIIIPADPGYVGRATSAGEKGARYRNGVGSVGLFNAGELEERGPVFVTEGAFDALAIIEAGGRAVALNSVSGASKLIDLVKKKRPKAYIILSLDEDKAGEDGAEKIEAALNDLAVPFTRASICGGCKDPNEALVKDSDAFRRKVLETANEWTPRPDNTRDYINKVMDKDIASFMMAGERKTGFSQLDKQAGGIFNGLYVIAGASSVGKTTFALQLADQLAAQGKDVLYFSMEQSKLELVTKSFARMTAQADANNAYSSIAIRTRAFGEEPVLRAMEEYMENVGDRVSIIEGDFMQTVKDIREKVRQYIGQTGERPVVIIDYLQLLQPDPNDRRPSNKETMDGAVTELKRMSRNLGVPVFTLSSVSRRNYYSALGLDALKESGGIEYTADVVWGLQFRCVHDDVFQSAKLDSPARKEAIDSAKMATPRELELVCLKNRYGRQYFTCNFDYYSQYDLFVTVDADKDEKKPWAGRVK